MAPAGSRPAARNQSRLAGLSLLLGAALAVSWSSSDASSFVAPAGRRGMLLAGVGAAVLGSDGAARAEEGEVVTFTVDLEGEQGGTAQVKVRLHPEWAPRGVRRFKELVRLGDFQDAAVYHATPRSAHFGLPAEPTLIPDKIKDDVVRVSNKRGTLTFAQTGHHSRVNQLFFNTADNSMLDAKGFAPIGEVLEGMEFVDQFYRGYGKRPSREDIIEQGNAYLDKEFPKLSKIKAVEVSA